MKRLNENASEFVISELKEKLDQLCNLDCDDNINHEKLYSQILDTVNDQCKDFDKKTLADIYYYIGYYRNINISTAYKVFCIVVLEKAVELYSELNDEDMIIESSKRLCFYLNRYNDVFSTYVKYVDLFPNELNEENKKEKLAEKLIFYLKKALLLIEKREGDKGSQYCNFLFNDTAFLYPGYIGLHDRYRKYFKDFLLDYHPQGNCAEAFWEALGIECYRMCYNVCKSPNDEEHLRYGQYFEKCMKELSSINIKRSIDGLLWHYSHEYYLTGNPEFIKQAKTVLLNNKKVITTEDLYKWMEFLNNTDREKPFPYNNPWLDPLYRLTYLGIPVF